MSEENKNPIFVKKEPCKNDRKSHLQRYVLARWKILKRKIFNLKLKQKIICFLFYRMGSFNSAPKINNADTQDDYIDIPKGLSVSGLLQHCVLMRGEHRPKLLQRNFFKPSLCNGMMSDNIADGLRVLRLNSVSTSTVTIKFIVSYPKRLIRFFFSLQSTNVITKSYTFAAMEYSIPM